MRSTLVLGLFQTIVVTTALVYNAPRQTSAADNIRRDTEWTPKPTTTASPGPLIHQPRLDRRQLNSDVQTCGWVSYDNGALTCSPEYACVSQAGNYFGCCSTISDVVLADCATYTSCFDYSLASSCTGACTSVNQVCNFDSPFCIAYVLSSATANLTAYQCTDEDTTRTIAVLITPGSASALTSFHSSSTTSSSLSTSTHTSTSTTLITTSTLPTPTASSASNGGSSHVGAIVGGVVGGVGGLLLIAGFIYYLMIRKKSQISAQMSEIQT